MPGAAENGAGGAEEGDRLVVAVRRAREPDARAIAELQDLANAGHLRRVAWARPGADWRDVGAAEIAGGATERALAGTLVAEADGAVIGMLNYAGNDRPPALADPVGRPFAALRRALGPGVYLRAMAVRPEFGGRGIAARLLDVAADAARRAEATSLSVVVHEGNGRLIAHYERRGFVRVAEERVVEHDAYPRGSRLIALRVMLREPI